MVRYKALLEKTLWSLAPLAWGGLVWFMWQGPGGTIVTNHYLNQLLRVVLVAALISYFFRPAFDRAAKRYRPEFFDKSLPLPRWSILIGVMVGAALLRATPLMQFETASHLIRVVLIGATLEEFVSRSFFVKYPMGISQFIIFNILSSLSFTLMQYFYV